MKKLIILLFILCSNLAIGQNKVDQIKYNIEISDAVFLDSLYLELYYELKKDNPDLALSYAEKSLEFSTRFNNHKNSSIAHYAIGSIHLANFNYSLAEENFNQSLDIALKYNLYERVLIGYSNLGILNSKIGKYDQAIDFYLKALKYAEKINDVSTIAALYNNIGLIHYRLSDFSGALNNY